MKSPTRSRRPPMTISLARPAPLRRRVAFVLIVRVLLGALGIVLGPAGAAGASPAQLPDPTTQPPTAQPPASPPPDTAPPASQPQPQPSPAPPSSLPPDLPVVEPPADPNAPPP